MSAQKATLATHVSLEPESARPLPRADGVATLAFSPDGKTLASGGGDATVKLRDVATGEELLTLDGFPGTVWMVRFSPDGKILATIGNTPGATQLRLWAAAGDDAVPAERPSV